MVEYVPERMPRGVVVALVVVWVQAVLNVLGGVLVMLAANDMASVDGGEDELLAVLGVASVVVAIVLAVAAFFAAGGFVWAWITILVIETLSVMSALLQMGMGNPFAALGLGLSILVIGQFLSPRAREWFRD